MPRLFVLFLAMFVMFTSVSGCGGGGGTTVGDGGGDGDGDGDTPTHNPDLHVITDEAIRLAYDASFRPSVSAVAFAADSANDTLFTSLPTPPSGTLDYAGYFELTILSAVAAADIDGVAVISVDLALPSNITGMIDGFKGVVTDPDTNDYLVSYDGVLNITDGGIAAGPNDEAAIFIVIDGNLNNGINEFEILGRVEGQIRGDNGELLYARGTSSGLDGFMNVTVDTDTTAISSIGTLSAELVPAP